MMTNDRPMTDENFEPWNGNIVDVTMLDGSHRTGLLARVDQTWIRLKSARDAAKAPDDGLVRIAETASIVRASRN